MMFEDNVGEDGLSAQSSYTININDSKYIDNLAPHTAMFDNKVLFGDNTLKTMKVMTLNLLLESL